MYRRGEWVRGLGSQPLGYVYDESTKNLRLDESQRENVALMWTLLADPSITAEKFVRLLADAGVTTRAMLKRGPDKTVGDMNDPTSFLIATYRYADLYRTGRHIQKLKNPFPGADHISTLPVLAPTDDYPGGHIEFSYDWGLPEGGWVEDEVIATALSLRRQPSSRMGGRSHDHVAPLVGTQWKQGGQKYLIMSSAGNQYELRVQPRDDV